MLSLQQADPVSRSTGSCSQRDGRARRTRLVRAQRRSLRARASASEVVVHAFRDGFFPYVGGEVKDVFEELKRESSPMSIFTHTRDDLHQDHRLLVRADLEHVRAII